MKRNLAIALVVALMLCGCINKGTAEADQNKSGDVSSYDAKNQKGEKSPMNIKVTSSAFKNEESIPTLYTCEGQDISPALSWSEVPKEAKSLALICDDPDAPRGTWVHWVVYYIPPSVTGFDENVPKGVETLDNGAKQGTNSWPKIGYGGPCPPSGTHRYFFKVYALDTVLNLTKSATKADVEKAMDGHVLAWGQLMGKYKKVK